MKKKIEKKLGENSCLCSDKDKPLLIHVITLSVLNQTQKRSYTKQEKMQSQTYLQFRKQVQRVRAAYTASLRRTKQEFEVRTFFLSYLSSNPSV